LGKQVVTVGSGLNEWLGCWLKRDHLEQDSCMMVTRDGMRKAPLGTHLFTKKLAISLVIHLDQLELGNVGLWTAVDVRGVRSRFDTERFG